MRQSRQYRVVSHVLSIGLCAIMIFPIYLMILGSFKPGRDMFDFKLLPEPGGLTLEGYRSLFSDESFFRSYGNTILHRCSLLFRTSFRFHGGLCSGKAAFSFSENLLFMYYQYHDGAVFPFDAAFVCHYQKHGDHEYPVGNYHSKLTKSLRRFFD